MFRAGSRIGIVGDAKNYISIKSIPGCVTLGRANSIRRKDSAKKKILLELGELLFDSNPHNLKLYYFGLLTVVVGILLIIIGSMYISMMIYIIGPLIVLIIVAVLFGAYSNIEKSRFKIYKNGIIMNAAIYSKSLKESPLGTHRIGKIILKYDNIESIHPCVLAHSIGLILTVPKRSKEDIDFIAGNILLSGSEMSAMPKVINLLKSQMGLSWKSKFRMDDTVSLSELSSSEVIAIIESEASPRTHRGLSDGPMPGE
jgi:hypothetical protein